MILTSEQMKRMAVAAGATAAVSVGMTAGMPVAAQAAPAQAAPTQAVVVDGPQLGDPCGSSCW
ncbi:hypothetical protein [Streptomyces odontomachi]|uniref:hypothetical protein n=1 Tax=Streptomyces odontomachi TaxID=2944940 RepID=UPI00210AA93A|nr:hypothetical protein [Streptomyces sp. ODS25]